MDREQLEHFQEIMCQLQKPLKELAELNVRTFQKINYFRPQDLSEIKKPEDLLKKNVTMTIQNSHLLLDHIQHSFKIIETYLLTFIQKKPSE